MRRQVPPVYQVAGYGPGFLVEYIANGRYELLGRDKLWHRRPEHCDPFPTREEAEAFVEKEAAR